MSSILFVIPSVKNIHEHPPIGTLLLSTLLNNHNITSEIFPLSEFTESDDFNVYINNMADQIAAKGTEIVSFYTRCDVYHIMLKNLRAIKAALSKDYCIWWPAV